MNDMMKTKNINITAEEARRRWNATVERKRVRLAEMEEILNRRYQERMQNNEQPTMA